MQESRTKNTEDFIFIKTGTLMDRVKVQDIYAIESAGNYCTILTDDKEYVQRCSLIKMKDKFSDKGYVQVNKSTLLNIYNINHVDLSENVVHLDNRTYSLSRNYRKTFIDTLELL